MKHIAKINKIIKEWDEQEYQKLKLEAKIICL